jgi:Mrp family chromosome partitioning ATPase
MKNTVAFDTSLTIFVRALAADLGVAIVSDGWFLRDASGHLTFVANLPLQKNVVEKITARIMQVLPHYCGNNFILDIDFPGVRRIVDSSTSLIEVVRRSDKKGDDVSLEVRLIDRRIVGHDWLYQPAPGWQSPEPARIVFASLKGGVGRSTGLAVLATDLAQKGRKVLAIDLDLEAPGIGTMLLRETDRPMYGALDWFVERGVRGENSDMTPILSEMVGASPFASNKGVIHVVPAVGTTSDEHPSNVLAKIARAYLEVPSEQGQSQGFLRQTQELIRQLASLNSYDVILIDARAGLNESTAAALLGLGADVMLFGIDTPQTFASYRYLLAHFAKFSRDENDDWLYRIRMIHAKASRDTDLQTKFRDRAYDIFKEFLYKDIPLLDEKGCVLLGDDGHPLSPKKEFGLTEPVAPHFAWPILADANFAEFDPITVDSQMKPEFYKETYAGLISGIDELLNNVGDET